MLKRDPDDVVLGKVSANRGQALANLISFISLKSKKKKKNHSSSEMNMSWTGAPNLLTMCRKSVFVRIDGNGMHSELMGRSEHADGDFLSFECQKKKKKWGWGGIVDETYASVGN
jgi:hypothetical protein